MNDKQLVALQAAGLVENGMIVGLGTGSTANFFIEELARRRREEGLQVTAVASSTVSTIKAQQLGLPLMAMEHLPGLDLYVDGADEITPGLCLLKGRGYDLVKEKLLARAASRFVVVADRSKLVTRIGEKFPVPVEVIPAAWPLALRALERAGASGALRPNAAGDGLAITSHGSLVLDLQFDAGLDAATLNALINDIPGVVEHGIFYNLAGLVLIADNGTIEERLPAS